MIFLLLLVFVPLSYSVKLEDLTWRPENVTKESILADNSKLINSTTPRTKSPVLAFVTPWNPRGYHLARRTAARLSHVSPVWFDVKPVFDENYRISDVRFEGLGNINTDFMDYLRERNPSIKIVPRFYFAVADFPRESAAELIQNEVKIQRIARKIAAFCKKRKFDGLVLEAFEAMMLVDEEILKINSIEALSQMGTVFKKNGLHGILSMPAPVKIVEKYNTESDLDVQDFEIIFSNFDFVQIWTYSNQNIDEPRRDLNEWVDENLERCGYSKKLMIGINFYGQEYSESKLEGTAINGKRFLEQLKRDDADLTFVEKAVEHCLVTPNSVICFPSMTSLEYRIKHAEELKMAISFWDYGQGLDYFTNLV